MIEKRIYGPPGCGKTTRLATKEIPKAVRNFGSDKVMVLSYTKTGARQIASQPSKETGQTIPVARKNVGTLHAMCYRVLGNPAIAEANVDQWNEMYPHLAIAGVSSSKTALDDFGAMHDQPKIGGSDGFMMLERVNILRAHMRDEETWPVNERYFYKRWKDFKSSCGYMDFTDLIETAIDKRPYAPGRPRVIYVDEAQDMSKLQLKLVRLWAMQADGLALVGDDDQCIFSFAGCTPEAFLYPEIPDTHKVKLDQSYRVPRAVHEFAIKIIEMIKKREPKKYRPRNFEGAKRFLNSTYSQPEMLVSDLKEKLETGKTAMILASCSYMLNDTIKYLHEEGIPFHNPYRRRRGDWNPLRFGSEEIVTGRDILLSFLTKSKDGCWSVEDFLTWAPSIRVCETGLVRKKASTAFKFYQEAIEQNVPGLESVSENITDLISEQGLQAALSRDINWLIDNLKKSRLAGIRYPITVFKKKGISAIVDKPKVIVGTIHSVKGGESDVVYLHPDLSVKGGHSRDNSREGYDQMLRLFYVGVTRAREEIVLLEQTAKDSAGLW